MNQSGSPHNRSDENPANPSPAPGVPVHEVSQMPGRRQLRRSKQDRIIGGVCGGLGRYVDVEPFLFRIAFLILLLTAGLGLILYIIAWIAMPEFKSEEDERLDSARKPINSRTAGTVVGSVLILFGSLILLERFVDWFDLRIVGGVVLIAIGALIVMRGLRREAIE